MLAGLNHLTFTVSQLEVSVDFYQNLLGFQCHVIWEKGAYLSVGHVWLCLAKGHPKPARDYTHVAFTADEAAFALLKEKLHQEGVRTWQPNSSEGDSLYILDPDGIQLEIHVGSLKSRLQYLKEHPYQGLQWHTPLPD